MTTTYNDKRISSISITDIGVFKQNFIQFPQKENDKKAEIHIFTGENGSGKTTLLQCLVSWRDMVLLRRETDANGEKNYLSFKVNDTNNLFNKIKSQDARTQLSFGDVKNEEGGFLNTVNLGGIASLIPENSAILNYLEDTSAQNTKPYDYYFFAYSGNRNLKNHAVSIEEITVNPFENATNFEKSTNSQLLVKWIANTITKAKLSDDTAKKQAYKQSITQIEKVISNIIDKPFTLHLDADTLEVQGEMDGVRMNFDGFPDGLKSMVSWIGDLLMRLERIKWVENTPLLERGFSLFLDEIEVHLHPNWQRKILPTLQNLFPNAQIFISTHSPFVVHSVDNAWVYSLKCENNETVIAEPVLSRTSQDVDYVLEKVFGIKKFYGEATQDELDKFYALRDKVWNKEAVDMAQFLEIARNLATKNLLIRNKIQYEMRQLARTTGEEAFIL